MISIVLEAKLVPDFTIVRLINSEINSTLVREVKVYIPDQDKQVIKVPGIVFLFREDSVTGIKDNSKVMVDFDNRYDVLQFIKDVIPEE